MSLIEDLTKDPVPPGPNIHVEFDPASQWYNASLTIVAGWIRTGGSVSYNTFAQPPATVRAQLNRLGVNTEELEANGQLRIWDWYTASLGQKSKEKHAVDSLKAADRNTTFPSKTKLKSKRNGKPYGLLQENSLGQFREYSDIQRANPRRN